MSEATWGSGSEWGWRAGNRREHVASILVSTLAAAFGVGLIQTTANLSDIFDSIAGTGSTALYCVAMVFILLAVYVAAIVTANTFATIVAGRTKTIALYRLIGASARTLRASVAREGLAVGVLGAGPGLGIGVGFVDLARTVGVAAGHLPDVAYSTMHPLVALPVVIVIATTWAASRVGSRRVLTVTPMQATGQGVDAGVEASRRRPARTTAALLLVVGGGVLLGVGVLLGLLSPAGVVVAFFGGAGSFTGILLGAQHIMPALLRLVGWCFGRSPSARLAAANAVRYPERSTRTALGLVIGVTLVVTFAVAMATFEAMLTSVYSQEVLGQALTVTIGILTGLIGFSAVIAGVGMVNNLSLNVLQRTRELGLLRALGFTRRQIRMMIVTESAQMVIASVGFGLVLGSVYGWAAAQSLLGSVAGRGIAGPTLPWSVLGAAVVGAAVLAGVASLAPARRAVRLTPVVALAEL